MHGEQHGDAGVGTPLSASTHHARSLGFPRGEKAAALTRKTHLMPWGGGPMEGS